MDSWKLEGDSNGASILYLDLTLSPELNVLV